MREYWERGKGGTKRRRHLIMYALSCEREQCRKSVSVREKKGGRDLEREVVCM